MSLLEYLVIGAYLYTSALWRWCWKMFNNHVVALEKRIQALEDKE
jgi:hypothetical protein